MTAADFFAAFLTSCALSNRPTGLLPAANPCPLKITPREVSIPGLVYSRVRRDALVVTANPAKEGHLRGPNTRTALRRSPRAKLTSGIAGRDADSLRAACASRWIATGGSRGDLSRATPVQNQHRLPGSAPERAFLLVCSETARKHLQYWTPGLQNQVLGCPWSCSCSLAAWSPWSMWTS